MNDLAVFNYTDTQIRTTIRDGAPWFVAKDVCDVLGIANTSQAVRSLDEDEFVLVTAALCTNEGSHATSVTTSDASRLTALGIAEASHSATLNLVNEPGLYSLILRSRKPEAKAFKRWITHDVLPVLRATGRYETTPATPEPDDAQIQQQAAIAAHRHLDLIEAMGSSVSRATREAMTQAVWAGYARTVGLPTAVETAALGAPAGRVAGPPDLIEQWLTDACEPYGPGTQAATLHTAFVDWCRAQGIHRQPTATRVGRRLTALGFPAHRVNGLRYRPLRAV